MLDHLFTTIFKLNALMRMRSCMRGLTAALLLFQVISWGALFIHNHKSVHAFGNNGSIIHIENADAYAGDVPGVSTEPTNIHDDTCCAFEHALRASTPVPVLYADCISTDDSISISREIIAKRLEIVYLSHLALDRAPKQSPPVTA